MICCGKEIQSAFCPACGTRVVANEFFGLTKEHLESLIADSGHNLNRRRAEMQTAEKEAAEIIGPAKKALEAAQAQHRKLTEARDYAWKQGVTREAEK